MATSNLRSTYSARPLAGSALAGAMFAIALILIRGGFLYSGSAFQILSTAALTGGFCGGLLLPPLTAVLLEQIPVGRALLVIWLLTTAAAVLASGFFSFDPALTALGGALGFVLATFLMRRSVRPPARVGEA